MGLRTADISLAPIIPTFFTPVGFHSEVDCSSRVFAELNQGASSIVWKRDFSLPLELTEEILSQPVGVQAVWPVDTDPWIVPALIDEQYQLSTHFGETLFQDIVKLMVLFKEVSECKEVGVRLEPIESDTCRLFHTDRVPLRMVCTYFGPGSEWIENQNVVRSGLGKGDNSLVMAPGAVIRSVPTGAVFFMRGEAGAETPAVVHRSPPIEKFGGRRILLRMDVVR
jgi:hypothetical protein